MARKTLTERELHDLADISDIEDISFEEDDDDSVADPNYDTPSSSSSSDNENRTRKRQKVMNVFEDRSDVGNKSDYSEDEERQESDEQINNAQVIWNDCTGNLREFPFTENPLFTPEFFDKREGDDPIHFYKFFIAEDVLSLIAQETNRYAEQKIILGITNETLRENSLLTQWKDTNPTEILTFLGMLMWMGLDQKPTLKDYFSRNILYNNGVGKYVGMSRIRFELLLSNIHFSNNESPSNSRLDKIQTLVKLLVGKFQEAYVPNKTVCIDETMVPFRGRLSFRQYIPGKRHKYGVKIFKLCGEKGYTYNLKIYSGKEQTPNEQSVATRVVLELMQPLLNSGRTLCTDNFYTSVSLAHDLLNYNTHLVGTLRKNRKYNPRPVIAAKLEKGSMIAKQSNTKVIVGKWKDKRDVLFLATDAVPSMVDVETKRGVVQKPSTIVAYNNIKSFIDVSDQKASYSSAVRRGIKWYRKVAIELLLNTAVVNAHIAYQSITTKTLPITNFREIIVNQIFDNANRVIREAGREEDIQRNHRLVDIQKRGRCTRCYKNSERNGRAYTENKTFLILNTAAKYKDILENKRTDNITCQQKNKIWEEITRDLNAKVPSGCYRSMQCLKRLYENEMKRARKVVAEDKKKINLTGGGPPTGIKKDPCHELILPIVNNKTVYGLNNPFDGDSDCNQIQNIDTDIILEYRNENDSAVNNSVQVINEQNKYQNSLHQQK
ncbi:hypothetical protein NQ318_023619 [Aromia moschata]|uniref:Regulatory protein zeste n=1 Tax=Aromia moschata TaxID=1265417 RepID=A0AAV8YR64_9CUCU|nr:hypothetical protein NQ318_023619 [Aromia moschata]